MSMSQPREPESGRTVDEQPDRRPADAASEHADPPDDPPTGDDVPFRTPDPREVGRT
jgi:hypothetical protein